MAGLISIIIVIAGAAALGWVVRAVHDSGPTVREEALLAELESLRSVHRLTQAAWQSQQDLRAVAAEDGHRQLFGDR